MYEIVERRQDVTGRYCVRVVLTPDEAVFLWFLDDPDQQAVDVVCDGILAARVVTEPGEI